MRTIKFRAWARRGEWTEDETQQAFIMIPGDALAFEEYAPLCDLLRDVEDDIYFMQYTGLKDKNGKEIYEGDLLTAYTSTERDGDQEWTMEKPCMVEWSENCAGFYPLITNARWRSDLMDIEVIGNIYENPELVKP